MVRLVLHIVFLSAMVHWTASGASLVLNSSRIHLGAAGSPEWEEFTRDPPGARKLDLRFNAHPNVDEAALFIRQDDVRQNWVVELNGKRIGALFLMEADLVHAIPIPPGGMREGENHLSILPPGENDDIVLHDIWIDLRPLSEALKQATLNVNVINAEDRKPLPCRVTIVDSRGALAPLLALTNAAAPSVAVRPGVIYTANGQARVGLLAGEYEIYASRGFEWSVATQHVHAAAGTPAALTLSLQREVPTPGYVSCDTHVHTFTHSRHGDATIDERMLTLAGEGIELPIATDHNLQIDYSDSSRRMGVANDFTPITGNEVTTPAGHFNIFPVRPDARAPDFRITDWPRLMAALRGTPDVRVVILNHPRNVHSNFQPFAATNFNALTGENKRGPEFTFDAVELLNSSAQQSDHLLVFRDWFALLNHGYRITAVGSSDSHDVSRYIVGQGRTYIACPDSDPARLDVSVACSNLLAGRALVSMGLLVQMTVHDQFTVGDLATGLGPQVRVQVQVLGPGWVDVTNVTLFANGVNIREWQLAAPAAGVQGVKAKVDLTVSRPAHDVHLIALATGPDITAPFWAIPRPYQPTSTRWTGRVIAATNPIWLDADGDGRFTSARSYARALIERYRSAPDKVFSALADFDEPTAVQAASLCAAAGVKLDSPDIAAALRLAAPHVQRGFEAFLATQR